MKRLLLLLWLVASPLMLAGQDYQAPEVKVSTEKVKIGEKLFLVHKVEPRQTQPVRPAAERTTADGPSNNTEFEDRLKKFMQESDSRIADNRIYADHRSRNRRR